MTDELAHVRQINKPSCRSCDSCLRGLDEGNSRVNKKAGVVPPDMSDLDDNVGGADDMKVLEILLEERHS